MNNNRLKTYLGLMYIVSLICFIVSYWMNENGLFDSGRSFGPYDILFFIILSIFLEYFTINHRSVAVSPGFAATVASILYFGVFWSMVICSISIVLRVIKHNGKNMHIFNTPIYKVLFNAATLSISIFASGVPYYINLKYSKMNNIFLMSVGFMVLILMFLIINALIISILMSILTGSKFLKTYAHFVSFGFLDIVFPAPFGVILSYLYGYQGALGALILLIPIILLRYVFKLYAAD